MRKFEDLTEEQLTRSLAYAGLILLLYELVKSLIVKPIQSFYSNVTFRDDMFFKSYDEDVRFRHQNEFEACLLYLRDFMEALDSDDLLAIQGLRKHRNDLVHDLVNRLHNLYIKDYAPILERADRVLFKLSNYRTRMEIGAEPELQNKGIDWETVRGHEYLIFEEVLKKVRILQAESK